MTEENKTQEPQPITWGELKKFINELPEEQLQNKIPVSYQDETAIKFLLEPYILEHEIYIYDSEPEDAGTLEELKEIHADENGQLDESLLTLVTPKGTPFLWLE